MPGSSASGPAGNTFLPGAGETRPPGSAAAALSSQKLRRTTLAGGAGSGGCSWCRVHANEPRSETPRRPRARARDRQLPRPRGAHCRTVRPRSSGEAGSPSWRPRDRLPSQGHSLAGRVVTKHRGTGAVAGLPFRTETVTARAPLCSRACGCHTSSCSSSSLQVSARHPHSIMQSQRLGEDGAAPWRSRVCGSPGLGRGAPHPAAEGSGKMASWR